MATHRVPYAAIRRDTTVRKDSFMTALRALEKYKHREISVAQTKR
jgi:hypothetical protein